MSRVPPHTQLDQCAPAPVVQALVRRTSALDFVQQKQSRFASPDTIALWIPDEHAHGPASAFIDDHEFCHIHVAQGMIHATLPDAVRGMVIEHDWGEWHTIAKAGLIARTIVVIYAPRDENELRVVCDIVRCSYQFARGFNESLRTIQ